MRTPPSYVAFRAAATTAAAGALAMAGAGLAGHGPWIALRPLAVHVRGWFLATLGIWG